MSSSTSSQIAKHKTQSINRLFASHPRLGLGTLLSGPILWLLVVYVGSLALLVVSAFFGLDEFTGKANTNLTLGNLEEVISENAYRLLVLRSFGVATAATVICFILA